MFSFFQGMGIGGGLIIAIGAQNAFVLSQGVRRNHPLQTALVCSFCDATLIIVGVSGVGALVASNPQLARLATWFGAIFLLWYGSRSFRSALQGGSLVTKKEQSHVREQVVIGFQILSRLPFSFLFKPWAWDA